MKSDEREICIYITGERREKGRKKGKWRGSPPPEHTYSRVGRRGKGTRRERERVGTEISEERESNREREIQGKGGERLRERER